MPPIPEAINHTLEAIYEAFEAKGFSNDNRGLAMSELANECERAIWYKLRWACPPERSDGQKQARFATGISWEEQLLSDLEAIGCVVERVDPATGKQFRVELADGWLRGKMDGTVLGLPEAPKTLHVVECKSHNDKSFKELLKYAPPNKGEGLKQSKFTHYVQCQMYCHAQGITRCLYYAVNKNDDDRYIERIEYDAAFALRLEAKVQRLIGRIDRAPPKLFEDPNAKMAALACGFCPAADVCHYQHFARQNCRTCIEAQFRDGANVYCKLRQKELSYDEQQQGCRDHIFLPELVPGSQSDANPELRTVTYQLADGSIWIDGVMK
jgi:hypothetical protein